jgi:Trypsin-like peptidase domain
VRSFVAAVCLTLAALAISGAQPEPTDNSLKAYVVRILWGPEQKLGGAGVYLGNGLVISAAHVAGGATSGVMIDDLKVPARIVKAGKFPQLDLSLVSIDEEKLPTSLRLLRMPLCKQKPQVGAPVIVAAPQGITRSRIASPFLIPANLRGIYSTLISEVRMDGKSGSGVFDAEKKCLLGILSQKIVNMIEHKDIATYFVPASTIQSFIPTGTHW